MTGRRLTRRRRAGRRLTRRRRAGRRLTRLRRTGGRRLARRRLGAQPGNVRLGMPAGGRRLSVRAVGSAQDRRVEAGRHETGQRLAVGIERPHVHGDAVGAGGEHLGGDDLAVLVPDHLPDGGDGPPPVRQLLDVHQQVQHLRDLAQHRVGRGRVGRALRVDQHLVDGGPGAARMDRAQRPVVADAHRLQELHHLSAAHLADDDPVRRHPQRGLAQVVHSDLAESLGVDRAGLERQRPLVQARRPQMQLEGVLDGDDELGLGNLGQQRAQQGGLPRAGASDHQHVGRVGGTHRGPEHRGHLGGHGAGLLEALQRGLEHPVAADHDRGPLGHRGDREEPVPRRQPQVEDRRGRVETARGVPGGRREVADHHDQLLLAAGQRRARDPIAAGQRQDHLVVAEDVDVLHVLALQQRHQRAAAHQPPDVGQELPLVLLGEPRLAGHEGRCVVVVDDRLGALGEPPVDHVGRQMLALELQELLEQPRVRPLEELCAGSRLRHRPALRAHTPLFSAVLWSALDPCSLAAQSRNDPVGSTSGLAGGSAAAGRGWDASGDDDPWAGGCGWGWAGG